MKAALLGSVAGAALACGAWAVAVEPLWLQVHRVQVRLPGLPAGLEGVRLGLLADLHAGAWAPPELYRRAARILADSKVDAILLAGDVTSRGAGPGWERVLAPLSEVEAPLGRLAVLGGHDHDLDARSVVEGLERLGFRVLRNEAVALGHGEEALWVVGLDDNSHAPTRDDFEAACRRLPRGAPSVVLAHSPDAAWEADRRGLGLVLSGHTHGGQVRLPFLGALMRVIALPRRFDQGLSRYGGTQVFVSRGLASTHRLRFLCRPDLAVVTLLSGEPARAAASGTA